MSDKTVANCAIVIPIYKENPSDDEVCALRQCLSVLGTYRIIFVTPRKLNHDAYLRICSEYDVSVSCETFGTKFFSDINGYNALLVSGEFYKRFLKYEYILIYQLDAFVFENKLAFWCERNYDYIGGPFFDLQRGAAAPRHTDFINGGLSLRKTNVFYQLAKTKLRLNFFFYLAWSRYDALLKQRSIIGFFKLVSFYCWMKFLCKIFNAEFGEDFIWTSLIRKHGKSRRLMTRCVFLSIRVPNTRSN